MNAVIIIVKNLYTDCKDILQIYQFSIPQIIEYQFIVFLA